MVFRVPKKGKAVMTVQEIHNSLKLLKSKRKEIIELKEQIAEAATYIHSSSWSSPKVTGGMPISPQERYLERVERLQKQYDRVFDEYSDLHYQMLELMNPLDAFDWTVILNRFFRGMSMKRTAEDMEYSVEYIKKCQAEAIKQMSEYSEAPPPK